MAHRKKQAKQTNKVRRLIAKLNPKSPITEQFRTVRTNLQFASIDEDLQTIVVTSSGPSEGKSSVTANLAVVYAQQGKKVLLVDADLRKPTVHYTFQLRNLKGLSNVLVGEGTLQEAISQTDVENLDVLSSGPVPPNPAELLGSRRMQAVIQKAREDYDVILFDTPPIMAVADAQVMANMCDGTMLVIRSKQTEYEQARKAIDIMQASTNAKFLGAVLNDHEKKKSNYYYYYGA